MEIISRRTAGFIFLSGLFLIFFFGFLTAKPLLTELVSIFGLALLVFFLYRPHWGIFIILFIRPSIDKFSDSFSISFRDVSLNASAILGSLITLLLLTFIIKNRAEVKTIFLKNHWLLFLLLTVTSVFFTVDFSASLYEITRILSIFLIFISIFIIIRKEGVYKDIINAIIYSSVIPFLFATYQLVTGTGLGGTSGIESRLFGTFSHPNPFASFIFIVLAMTLFSFIQEKKISRRKWFLGAIIVWGVFLLIQTYSRGAWLAFLIFLSILTAIRYPKALLVIIFGAAVLFFTSSTIRDRVEDIYNPPADSSVRWRFAQWERMYGLFLKKPLTGYGIGTEIIVHEREFGPNAGNQYTHNDFLRVALETGVIGALAYFILLLAAFIKLFLTYLKEKDPLFKDLKLFILALFIALVSFSLTNNTLRETVTQWTLWSLIAIALSLSAKTNYLSKKN